MILGDNIAQNMGPGWSSDDGQYYDFEGKGWVKLYEDNDHWMIDLIQVNPEHRRKGVGTRMLKDLLSLDSKPVHLQADPTDPSIPTHVLVAWYEKHGFVVTPGTDHWMIYTPKGY